MIVRDEKFIKYLLENDIFPAEPLSNTLKWLNTTVLTQEECAQQSPGFVLSQNICAATKRGGHSVCFVNSYRFHANDNQITFLLDFRVIVAEQWLFKTKTENTFMWASLPMCGAARVASLQGSRGPPISSIGSKRSLASSLSRTSMSRKIIMHCILTWKDIKMCFCVTKRTYLLI